MVLQESFDLSLTFKTPRCVTFHDLFDDRSHGLIAHQNLALATAFLIAVANGRGKDAVSVHQAALHAVAGLLAVLLALVLRH
nr:hypothetical protein [Pseudaestuariivita rosea]